MDNIHNIHNIHNTDNTDNNIKNLINQLCDIFNIPNDIYEKIILDNPDITYRNFIVLFKTKSFLEKIYKNITNKEIFYKKFIPKFLIEHLNKYI